MATNTFVVDVSRDWLAASEVQRRFMQTGPATEALCYKARCRQLRELGGDFYDFVSLPDNRLALAIGDASGKGLAAALMISNVQSSLRTAASIIDDDLAAVLEVVNHQVYGSSLSNRYATLFYGVFDGATRRLRYVNAGHNPPLVIRSNKGLAGSIGWLEACGAPLGLFPSAAYSEGVIQLNPGDLVIAYTDGVTEALNLSGEEWGTEGLKRVAEYSGAECADDSIDAIFASMDEFSAGRQMDDATALVLHVH
jgi:phosphoserine phosphatase RsbU/P